MHHVPLIRNRLTATYGKPIRKRTFRWSVDSWKL